MGCGPQLNGKEAIVSHLECLVLFDLVKRDGHFDNIIVGLVRSDRKPLAALLLTINKRLTQQN